jgi:hypothetical protein
MRDVNGWLMALAFVLGLLLTFAMMIRRVTREVPITHTVSAKAGVGAAGAAVATGAAATLRGAAEKVEKKVDKVEQKLTEQVEKAERVLEKEPYGAGSIRVSARTEAPAGYTIKGDKDTGRYFTKDSPDYPAIEAEVWFADEESAQKAGFLRWDAKGDAKAVATAAAAAVITEKHVEAETIITEDHTADASLVIVDDGPDVTRSSVRVVSGTEGAAAPYGKGSSRAGADGSGPEGWLIKGNADSMLYHGPDSPSYKQTIAEVWFADETTARAAGFKRWDHKR